MEDPFGKEMDGLTETGGKAKGEEEEPSGEEIEVEEATLELGGRTEQGGTK